MAVHQVLRFGVPRPRGLLGHEHLTRLVDAIRKVIERSPSATFETFHLSAAGTDSPVFVRLKQELAAQLGLESVPGPAHLQLAVYPSADRSTWIASVRLSPSPLSARSWRVCNYPGALNATIAYAMAVLATPRPSDRVLNLCCGSGTLLVERLQTALAAVALGIDLSWDALACARSNVEAAGVLRKASLVQADATRLPLAGRSIDVILTDLPYGQLIGGKSDVEGLYRGAIAEATRVVVPGGRLVAITTRKRLFDTALDPHQPNWRVEKMIELKVPYQSGYLRPVVYTLVRGR